MVKFVTSETIEHPTLQVIAGNLLAANLPDGHCSDLRAGRHDFGFFLELIGAYFIDHKAISWFAIEPEILRSRSYVADVQIWHALDA